VKALHLQLALEAINFRLLCLGDGLQLDAVGVCQPTYESE
jgi:hypothetical protein